MAPGDRLVNSLTSTLHLAVLPLAGAAVVSVGGKWRGMP